MLTNKYDLEERTQEFALKIRRLAKKISLSIGNVQDVKQLIRSSGSVAANYIEANEALSKKDFIMRIKICRKEAKESILWLKLLDISGKTLKPERDTLMQEGTELMKIMSVIMRKSI